MMWIGLLFLTWGGAISSQTTTEESYAWSEESTESYVDYVTPDWTEATTTSYYWSDPTTTYYDSYESMPATEMIPPAEMTAPSSQILPPEISLDSLNHTSTSLTCLEANARLSADLTKCTAPLSVKAIESSQVVDQLASTVVACICSSRWSPTAEEMNLSIQPQCPAPNGLSKENQNIVYNSCKSNPFSYDQLAKALDLKATLVNGQVYRPFSAASSSPRLLVQSLFVFLAFLAL